MSHTRTAVAIVGGGISGLSTAWYLQQQSDRPYTLLEADKRWGGKIVTELLNGYGKRPFIIDGGPDTFVTRKAGVRDLAQGLDLDFVETSNETKSIYVLDDGKPIKLPMNPIAFVTSPLMSIKGKARMLAEPFVKARRDHGDESLADFTARRLGREALEKFIGPVLGGIYNADPENQSILTTSPIMREMEQDHGSLFKAAFVKMRQAQKAKTADDSPRPPRFVTFENGAGDLIEALTSQLRGDLRLNCGVERISTHADGYALQLQDGSTLVAEQIVLAVTANVAARLLAELSPASSQLLSQIQHVHIGTMSLVYKASDLAGIRPLQGLMIPRREKRKIDAITWTSFKSDRVRPDGYELIRVFFGGGAPEVAEMDDAAREAVVSSELRELLGIKAAPLETRSFRWLDGYPQAAVGHLDLVTEIENSLPSQLYVTGSSYRGLAVPDCIQQGQNTATLLIQHTPERLTVQ